MSAREFGGYPESCVRQGLFQTEPEQVLAIVTDLFAALDAAERIAPYAEGLERLARHFVNDVMPTMRALGYQMTMGLEEYETSLKETLPDEGGETDTKKILPCIHRTGCIHPATCQKCGHCTSLTPEQEAQLACQECYAEGCAKGERAAREQYEISNQPGLGWMERAGQMETERDNWRDIAQERLRRITYLEGRLGLVESERNALVKNPSAAPPASGNAPADTPVSGLPGAAVEGPGEVTITTNELGECVAVTRTDDEGRILKVLWERDEQSRLDTSERDGEARELLRQMVTIAAEAREHLDADRDCKALKLLGAMAGDRGYRRDLDVIHAFLERHHASTSSP